MADFEVVWDRVVFRYLFFARPGADYEFVRRPQDRAPAASVVGAGSLARRFCGAFTAGFPWSEVGRGAAFVAFEVMFSAIEVGAVVGIDGRRFSCANAVARLVSYFIYGPLIGCSRFGFNFDFVRRSFFGFGGEFIDYVRVAVVGTNFPIVPVLPCVMT